MPPYHLVHSSELLAYAALGLAGGGVSLIFVRLVAVLRPRLRALPPWTWYWQPAIAGAAIGLIALRFPQVMGAGYEYINQAMHEQFGWRILVVLCLLKIATTTLSFVTGTPGGLFAPTLFMGAMLGGAVCGIERHFAPVATGPIGAYALVGMGTMFAGTLRAPMTSVFMIVEVSGNYSIVLPLMISNTVAYLVSRRFQRIPLFDLLGRQDGTDLPSMEEEREVDIHTVEDAMRGTDGTTLNGDETVTIAIARAQQVESDYFLVTLGKARWGGISRAVLLGLPETDGERLLKTAVSPIAPPYLYPDHSLEAALRVLHQRPFVPVVHRADGTRLLGVLSLEDVLRVFRADSPTTDVVMSR